eukprot:1075696-Pelagomonas_calceolata.AAC.8
MDGKFVKVAPAGPPYRPLEETPIAWVDTPEALTAMASELQGEQHIAVDLEHHSYRCECGEAGTGARGGSY